MATPNKHVKAVMDNLELPNIKLAKALGFDPSLIS